MSIDQTGEDPRAAADSAGTIDAPTARQQPGFFKLLRRRRSVLLGLTVLTLLVLAAALAPLVPSLNPQKIDVANRLAAPSSTNWMGTDNFGRDIATRVIYGGRVSLWVGFQIMIAATVAGTLLGLFAGFYRRLDMLLMRLVDGIMVFPGLILAVGMIGVMGPGTLTIVVALSIVFTPYAARIVRGSVLKLKEYPFVEAERALGASNIYILFWHILPNALSPLIVQASFIFSYAVLAEAALSFLGVGVDPTLPSWGNMLSDSREYLRNSWWMAVFPGLAIVITVLSLNIVGDGIRDTVDPRLRDA